MAFTTWIEGVPLIVIPDGNLGRPLKKYRDKFDVPEPVRAWIRECYAVGVPPSDIAKYFEMDLSWVAEFIGDPK